MSTLTDFLLARIAEDEAVARDVLPSRWPYEPYGHRTGGRVPGISEDWQGTAFRPVSEHIARHDPAHVLAECDAKRRIVERARLAAEAGESAMTTGAEDAVDLALEGVLREMATVYADHPDYAEATR